MSGKGEGDLWRFIKIKYAKRIYMGVWILATLLYFVTRYVDVLVVLFIFLILWRTQNEY